MHCTRCDSNDDTVGATEKGLLCYDCYHTLLFAPVGHDSAAMTRIFDAYMFLIEGHSRESIAALAIRITAHFSDPRRQAWLNVYAQLIDECRAAYRTAK